MARRTDLQKIQEETNIFHYSPQKKCLHTYKGLKKLVHSFTKPEMAYDLSWKASDVLVRIKEAIIKVLVVTRRRYVFCHSDRKRKEISSCAYPL